MVYPFLKKIFSRHFPGQSVIELLLAMGLAAVFLPALLTGLIASREGRPQQIQRQAASFLLQEAVEAARSLREYGWLSLPGAGVYHPAQDPVTHRWTLPAGSEPVGDFTRTITVSEVYRDATGAIVPSGGTLDPSSKKLTIEVSWIYPKLSSVGQEIYLTRYRDNLTYVQTTKAEFDTGTRVGTSTTSTYGGEVVLSTGGQNMDWCEPVDTDNTYPITAGVTKTIFASYNRVITGTGGNNAGLDFININTANLPGQPVKLGDFKIAAGGTKVNQAVGDSEYAYLATDNNAKEVMIIDIRSLPYSEIGWYDAPGNVNGKNVFASGSVGFVATTDQNLYSFDIQDKSTASGRLTYLYRATLDGQASKMTVSGGFVYVAITGATNTVLQKFNANDLTPAGKLMLTGRDAVDVSVSGERAYLAMNYSATAGQHEMYIVNTVDMTEIPGGYFDTNTNMVPTGLTKVAGSNRVILIGNNGTAGWYLTLDVSNENLPTHCGSTYPNLTFTAPANAVDTIMQGSHAFSYVITDETGRELHFIEGGSGGGSEYLSDGTYTSAPFDSKTVTTREQTAFNYFFATVSTPNNTGINFEFAVADPVADSCDHTNYVYVPVTGILGAVPLDDDGSGYENPGRCLRYRANLSSPSSDSTPVLYDMTVNFSP